MTIHEFGLLLNRNPSDAEVDRLYEAFDESASVEFDGPGPAIVHVHRAAASLDVALVNAVVDVESVGFTVTGLVTPDHVTLRVIAERTGRTYESVRRLANGSRGPGGFPAPLSADGWSLYSWARVSTWFADNYGGTDSVTDQDRAIAAADLVLRARALLRGEMNLAPLLSLPG